MATIFGFDGTKEDGTGNGMLNEMGTRLYSPSSGQWTQQDSFEGLMTDPGGLNRYAFVEGDPVNFVDPYGLCNLAKDTALTGLGLAGFAGSVLSTPVTTVGGVLLAGSALGFAGFQAWDTGQCAAATFG